MDIELLPIFLAGCSQLLMLTGPSYLSRMWPVAEVFMFEQLKEQLDGRSAAASGKVHMVALPGGPSSDALGRFDAARCECTYEADRAWLLMCCVASCGTLQRLNERAARLLTTAAKSTELGAVETAGGASGAELAPPPSAAAADRGIAAGGSGGGGGGGHALGGVPARLLAGARAHPRGSRRLALLALAISFTYAFVVWAGEPARAACAACARVTSAAPVGADGWVRHGSSQYRLVRRALQWAEAHAECSAAGARLVRIDDRAEDAFVACLVSQHSSSAWIGLSQDASSPPGRAWAWTDGGALGADGGYVNWAPGFPNRGAKWQVPYSWEAERYCAATGTTISPDIRSPAQGDVGTRWFDAQCATVEAVGFFVCERPAAL